VLVLAVIRGRSVGEGVADEQNFERTNVGVIIGGIVGRQHGLVARRVYCMGHKHGQDHRRHEQQGTREEVLHRTSPSRSRPATFLLVTIVRSIGTLLELEERT
jgi:hypothetical protein